MRSIRHIAICVFRNENRILVISGKDRRKNERFYRPLGGAIESGELAVAALRREIREELGQEIQNPVQLGVLESRFEYAGKQCHEIAIVFDACFTDPAAYLEQTIAINEPGWDGPAFWLDLSASIDRPLYPDGLINLLLRNKS